MCGMMSMKKDDKVTKESVMSDIVKTALLRGTMKLPDGKKLKCDIALREFRFKDGIYDVVGYNKQENTVYIIECKLGTNVTSIGQAFGQIISYKSLLVERGYDFLTRFYKKYNEDVIKTKGYQKIQLEDWMKIINKKTINFRFFVALKEESKKLWNEIIAIKNNINFKIGLLMVTKIGVCTPRFWINEEVNKKLAENDIIKVPILKKYAKKFDFLEALEEKLKEKLPTQYSGFKSYKATTSYKQFKLYPNTHYEVAFTKGKQVEIGLHVEANKEITENLFIYLLKKENQIKSILGKNVKIEKWGRGWATGKGAYWARVFERIPREDLDENFLEKVSERLKEYIMNLQPILEQSE